MPVLARRAPIDVGQRPDVDLGQRGAVRAILIDASGTEHIVLQAGFHTVTLRSQGASVIDAPVNLTFLIHGLAGLTNASRLLRLARSLLDPSLHAKLEPTGPAPWHRKLREARVLGNVISSGIKLMVLTIIVGIGSTIFGSIVPPAGAAITLKHAASIILAAIAVFGLAIFIPAIAAGLVSGAPQLGAGAIVGTAAGVAASGVLAAGGARWRAVPVGAPCARPQRCPARSRQRTKGAALPGLCGRRSLSRPHAP